MAIVCEEKTYDVVSAFSEMAEKCAGLLAQNRGSEATPLFLDLERRHYAVINALRRELGIEETTPQYT